MSKVLRCSKCGSSFLEEDQDGDIICIMCGTYVEMKNKQTTRLTRVVSDLIRNKHES